MDTAHPAATQTTGRSLASQVLEDGFFVGVIGAAIVALWYLVLDSLAGRPLFTPSLLGSILFRGASDASQVTVSASTVAWYTAVHVLAFLGVGIVASWLAMQFEKFPAVGIAMLFLFVVFEAAFFFFAIAVGRNILGVLGLWSVAVANLLAAAAMAAYLWWRHPQAVRGMNRIWRDQE
jgi:hypothetical protein